MTQIYDYDEYENYEDPDYPEISYIIYYPAGKYVFNRSLNLSSLPYRKYLNALKVVGREYLNKTIGRIVSTPLDMDTKGIEILEVVNLDNLNRRNQKTLNEIKKKWCEKLGAVCDVRDIIDENAVGEKIKCSVLKRLDDEFCKLSKALAPFIRKDMEEFDPMLKEYASDIKGIKRYIKTCDLIKTENEIKTQIEEAKKKLDELNDRLTNLPDDIIKMQNKLANLKEEVGRWETFRDMVKYEHKSAWGINALFKNAEEEYFSSPGHIVEKLEIWFSNLRDMIAAFKFIYKMSLEDIKEYFKSNIRVMDHYNYGDMDKIYNGLTDKSSAMVYICHGYEYFKKLVNLGKIKI